jgi:hypothetical protein
MCLSGALWEEVGQRVTELMLRGVPPAQRSDKVTFTLPPVPTMMFIHRYSPGEETGMVTHADVCPHAAVVINLTGDQDELGLYWVPDGTEKGEREHIVRDKFSMGVLRTSVKHGVELLTRTKTRMTLNMFV